MKLSWCTIFLFFASFCTAQKGLSFYPHKKAITFSPLALADMDHSVTIGAEYFLNNKNSVVLDVSYIFNSDYLDEGIKGASGITFRPAFRLYGRSGVGYWQNQLLFKTVTYKMHGWLGKDCVNDVPSYEQEQNFKFNKKVFGLNTMFGQVFRIFSDQWYLDAYAGLGIRIKHHNVVNQPNSCYNLSPGFLINIYEENTILLSVPIGIKIGYVR